MTTSTTLESPRIERREAMLIAGLGGRYSPANRDRIAGQWQHFAALADTLPGRIGRARYGVSTMTGDGFDYVTGVEVSSAADLPAGLRALRIPARRYAVFPHRGHVSAIPETCEAIGRDWLPSSGYKPAGAPEIIERYGEAFDPARGTGGIEVWIPIKG